MDEQEKQEYLEQYHQDKQNGVPFYPVIIFKDVVVSFIIFLILIGLASIIGVPLEGRANPADTTYTPRPEWYFLFLFQLLKYFPGTFEVVGAVVIPTLIITILFLLPLLDRNTRRHYIDRPIVTGITVLAVAGIISLTILAVLEDPPPIQATQGYPVAMLYTQNSAHVMVRRVQFQPDQSMPYRFHDEDASWNGTLSRSNQWVGWFLSPGGSILSQYCGMP
jgi:quinol-cytochrome oxidoreductase complex cytochrome b subunit